MGIIKINNTDIYIKEYGSGQPLIMISGLGTDSTGWLPVIVGLSKHFRVITFDNRGVGQSSHDNSNITIKDMADDCMALISQLKLSDTVVLGHSMGGMIAMDMAVRYPDIVSKLILEATSPVVSIRNVCLFNDWIKFLEVGMDRKLWFRNLFYWIFHPDFFKDETLLDQAVNMALNYRFPQSNDSFKNQVDAIFGFDYEKRLSDIEAETLIIHGENDYLFPQTETNSLFNQIRNGTQVIIPGTAHSVHMDNPEEFIYKVVGFAKD